MKIGKRIEKLRIEKGYNQSQLARLVKLKAPAISQYESGKRMPSVTALFKLARVLETTADHLINGSDEINDPNSEMLILYENLSQANKDHAINYIKFLTM